MEPGSDSAETVISCPSMHLRPLEITIPGNDIYTWITRANDRIHDFILGIRTVGLIKSPVPGFQASVTLPYKDIIQILTAIDMTKEDVFVDIGCGLGRVVCCAARLPVRKVIGIEVMPDICRRANDNASRVRGRQSSVEFVNISATQYHYDEGTVFYMYHPFDARIMGNVLTRIRESLSRRKRRIKIIYANPVHESALTQCWWLREVARWEPLGTRSLAVAVSFWETRD